MCYRQRLILKIKSLIALFIVLLIISGCGQSGDTKIDSDKCLTEAFANRANEESDIKSAEIVDKPGEDLPKPPPVPINNDAENIHYYSEDGIDLIRAMRRCKSDGKNIYLVHGEPDLYVMPVGTDEHSPANIDNPEGMDVCNIALDAHGRIHLLMAGHDNEEWFIWRLDENYQAEKKIDISAYFETKQMPLWFLIDKDGTFYFKWAPERNGIIVDSEGVLKHKFTRESLGIRWIYDAAVGKDGEIYLLHDHTDEKLEIGKLDMNNCLIENENPALYFPGDEVFTLMSGGTDTNLLLFSPYSGVWAHGAGEPGITGEPGRENGILENRMKLSDIRSDFDDEFLPLVFLPDGRLVLLGLAANGNNADNADGEGLKPLLLKYMPVGE